MIRKRLTKRLAEHHDRALAGYDPHLVITVDGLDDVYRLARHLEQGQAEFAAMGRRILRSMDEQAPGVVRHLTARMGPSRHYGYQGRRRRPAKPLELRLGMPDDELQRLEEAVR